MLSLSLNTARFFIAAVATLVVAQAAFAQQDTRWVTDEFEITMRGGPSTDNRIVRMLSSGTPLTVLEVDDATGYTRVRLTTSNAEGYVLTRYLMGERDARSQLAELTERLETLRDQSGDRGRELDDLRQANAAASQRIASLEQANTRLQADFDALQTKSANVINIDRENTTLRKELTDTQIQLQSTEEENRELSTRRALQWFIIGALVLLVGIVLGLILPGMRRRKRGGYGGDLI
ncbi:MAG: TIGR04211 family SH3 domain-containing protein [Pseudomonadota bacterium]